jgi:bacterial/archaeal transporter family protein
MGGLFSKSEMKRSSSSSAAFGRLRIDSPKFSTTRNRALHHLKQQRAALAGGDATISGGGGARLLRPATTTTTTTTTTISTETSPLLYHPTSPESGFWSSPAGAAHLERGLSELSATNPPPLALWIGPALCCAMAYALYNIFIKKGSASINPVLGGVILQLVAAMLGMVLLSFLMVTQGKEDVLIYDADGIKWAILAGVSVGAAEITSFFVSSLGVQAMQSIPIIIGGSVMFGTVMGAVALQEVLTYRGWFGVVLISVGISLVGMDDSGVGG